jgi:hypothetical protein
VAHLPFLVGEVVGARSEYFSRRHFVFIYVNCLKHRYVLSSVADPG